MPRIRSTGIGNSPREHSRYAVDTPMPNSCAASDIDSVKHSVPVRDPLSRCRASGGAGAHPSPSGSGSWCPQDENGAASSARAGGRPRACRPSRPLPAGERSGRRLPWPHNLASRDEGKLNWAKGSCDKSHACRQVDPRGVDAYDNLAVLRSREHHLRELQHLWPAELIDADWSYSWYLLPLEGHLVQKVCDPHSQQRLDSTLHILRLEQRTSCIKDHLVGVADTGVKVFADQPLCDMMR